MELLRDWRKKLTVEQKDKENIQEVFPFESLTSEDVHGGLSATKDIQDSPNPADQGQQEKQQQESQGQEEQQEQEQEQQGSFQRESYYQDRPVLFTGFLQNSFAKLIRHLSEESFLWQEGDEQWDFQKLFKRRFYGYPLRACRKAKRKEKIVLALDFSGSCAHLTEFFLSLAQIAFRFQEVEVLDASNGFAEENQRIGQEGVVLFQELFGRKVLFFGDFDGGASLVELSQRAKVWWFSCEERYEDLSEHDWCKGYTLQDFKGIYLPCRNEQELVKLVSKLTI